MGEERRAGDFGSNVVLIGKKPTFVYVVASLMQMKSKGQVVLKARGRAISKAVDVVQVLRRRFLGEQFTVAEMRIGTERLPATAEGLRERNVSSMEITLKSIAAVTAGQEIAKLGDA